MTKTTFVRLLISLTLGVPLNFLWWSFIYQLIGAEEKSPREFAALMVCPAGFFSVCAVVTFYIFDNPRE